MPAACSAVFANGARMSVATEAQAVRGVAVWRLIENTYEGRRLYVDDLVTDETHRSPGIGRALLRHLEQHARNMPCDDLAFSIRARSGPAPIASIFVKAW